MENRSLGHRNPQLGTAAGGGGQGDQQQNPPCPAGATLPRWAEGEARSRAEPTPLGEQKWENAAQDGLVYGFFPDISVGLTRHITHITHLSPKSFPSCNQKRTPWKNLIARFLRAQTKHALNQEIEFKAPSTNCVVTSQTRQPSKQTRCPRGACPLSALDPHPPYRNVSAPQTCRSQWRGLSPLAPGHTSDCHRRSPDRELP